MSQDSTGAAAHRIRIARRSAGLSQAQVATVFPSATPQDLALI